MISLQGCNFWTDGLAYNNLKILGIPYYIKDINVPIHSNIVEKVIQTTHIFNNIVLASYSHINKDWK